jgi:hypothetical protein
VGGKHRIDLTDVWDEASTKSSGTTISRFPDLLVRYTPQAPTLFTYILLIIEVQVEIAVKVVTKVKEAIARSSGPIRTAGVG